MQTVIHYMTFIEHLYLGVVSAFTNTHPLIQFEQVVLIGSFLFMALLFCNILSIVKLLYTKSRKKKGTVEERKSESPFQSQSKKQKRIKSANLQEVASTYTPVSGSSIFKKIKALLAQALLAPKTIFSFVKTLIKRSLSLKGFAHARKTRKEVNLKIVRFEISFLLLWGIKLILINAVVIFAIVSFVRKYFLIYPYSYETYPTEASYWDDFERPIEITFDIPIDKKSLIINMAPETAGRWEFEKSFSFLPFSRRVRFYPDETVYPGEHIMIYLTDLSNHFHTMDGGEHMITFHSTPLPNIESVAPEHKAENVPTDQEVIIKLNQKDGPYVEWDFQLNKKAKFQTIRDNSKTIKLSFENPLNQGETYKFKIYQTPLSLNLKTGETTKRGEKELVYTLKFTTVAAPLVSEMSPTGSGVLIDEKIRVVFDVEMEKEEVEDAFSIAPQIEGEISWEDDKTFVFTPDAPLTKETHYEVKFEKGVTSKIGGVTEQPIIFSFDTIGAVRVQGWSPTHYASGVSISSPIYVTFDQQVDHTSAQSHFSISPSVTGAFSWNGNTMVFSHSSPFAYSTQYTVTITAGIKTVYGLDSRDNFSLTFTTEANVIVLNVPQYYQSHRFGCNITAIAMALSYKGAPSSEMTVYNGIGKDNTPCTRDGSGNITYWGNPHVGYIGDLDGGGDCGGYGVYWGPASSYMSSRGVSNQIRTGWNVVGLAQEVEAGNPVVIWWQNGWADATWRSWNSPTGTVNALNGMHSEVVVGFIGPSSNPTYILTNDPWRGRRQIDVVTFDSMWGYFNRTGVVLY